MKTHSQSIRLNAARIGNFTSSEIVRLCGWGEREMTADELAARPKTGEGSRTKKVSDPNVLDKAALTYIEECNYERGLGRCIDNEVNARATSWGTLVERQVFELLGTEYKLSSNKTLVHPIYDYWAGSPDALKFDEGRTVCDIKAPLTLLSFCRLVAPIYMKLEGMEAINWIRDNHKDGNKYYWQLVSNSVLTDAQFAELIVYAPYKRDLEDIRDMAALRDDADQYRFAWIGNSNDSELPYLIEGGKYRDMNIIRFEVPVSDKQFIIDRVRIAGKLLDKSF